MKEEIKKRREELWKEYEEKLLRLSHLRHYGTLISMETKRRLEKEIDIIEYELERTKGDITTL